MCPFVVSGESGRFLEMRSSVSPGEVVLWPFFIASMNVEGAGLKHAPWRNWANLFWSCSYGQYIYLPMMVYYVVSVGCPIDHLFLRYLARIRVLLLSNT